MVALHGANSQTFSTTLPLFLRLKAIMTLIVTLVTQGSRVIPVEASRPAFGRLYLNDVINLYSRNTRYDSGLIAESTVLVCFKPFRAQEFPWL